jgi:hypothetical protein
LGRYVATRDNNAEWTVSRAAGQNRRDSYGSGGFAREFRAHVEEAKRVLDFLLRDEHALDVVSLKNGERCLARERA